MIKYFLSCCLISTIMLSCSNKNTDESQSIQTDNNSKLIDQQKPVQSEPDTLIFKWQNDMCEVTGYFLSDQQDSIQLRNILEILNKLNYAFMSKVNVFRPQDIKNIDINELTKEYQDILNYVESHPVIDDTFWKEWIETEKKNLKMRYDLTKMKGEAFKSPSVLLNNKYIEKDSKCNKYASALNADEETLYKVWEEWVHETKVNNGDPESYVQRFHNEFNSDDRLAYAYINLINFGWWNCVNQYINYPDNELLNKEFEKLFIRTEYECEEP